MLRKIKFLFGGREIPYECGGKMVRQDMFPISQRLVHPTGRVQASKNDEGILRGLRMNDRGFFPKTKEDTRNFKIAWISYHFYPEYLGGAELTDYALIEQGLEEGLNIDRLTQYGEGYDLYIASNIHWKELNAEFYDEDYIYFCHDSLPIDPFEQKLLSNSLANIFMSPLHLRWASSHFDLEKPNILQPAAMNPQRYYSKEKEDVCAYVGLINKHKGIENILDFAENHPSLKFKLYGRNEYVSKNLFPCIFNSVFFRYVQSRIPKKIRDNISGLNTSNVSYEGVITDKEKLDVLARAKYLIHLPNWVEAFGRTVMEGYFSDCKLIVNDKVGCLSYDWDFSDKEHIKDKMIEYKESFWNRLLERYHDR